MPTEQKENSGDEAEIRALLEDLAERVRAKDINGVLSHYAAEKVQFLLAPPLRYAGANALKEEDVADWFSTFQGARSVTRSAICRLLQGTRSPIATH